MRKCYSTNYLGAFSSTPIKQTSPILVYGQLVLVDNLQSFGRGMIIDGVVVQFHHGVST